MSLVDTLRTVTDKVAGELQELDVQFREKKERIAALEQRVAELTREVEGLWRDKERLDWLEKNHVEVTSDDTLLFWRSSSRKIRPLRQYIDDTREAIDAARDPQTATEHAGAGQEKPINDKTPPHP